MASVNKLNPCETYATHFENTLIHTASDPTHALVDVMKCSPPTWYGVRLISVVSSSLYLFTHFFTPGTQGVRTLLKGKGTVAITIEIVHCIWLRVRCLERVVCSNS